MTDLARELAHALREKVVGGHARAMRSELEKVSGRSPNDARVARSDWYKSLGAEDQRMVLDVAQESAEMAVFSTLVFFDGGDVISEELRDWGVRIVAVNEGEEVLISSTTETGNLHDYFCDPVDTGGTRET